MKGVREEFEKAYPAFFDRNCNDLFVILTDKILLSTSTALDSAHTAGREEIIDKITSLKEICEECENNEVHDTPRNKILDEILEALK